MQFRQALPADLEVLTAMYRRLTNYIEETGVHIWDDQYPCPLLAGDIEQGRLYAIFNGEEPVGAFALCAAVLILFPNLPGRLLIESAMTCFICPTACAAAVVCAKLGGHAAHLITYILLINLAAALFIPLIVPLVNPTEGQTFIATSVLIIRQVFPTLICPLLLAWGIRFTLPRLAQRLQNTGDTAFYLWTVALTMAIAVTTRSIMHSHVALPVLVGIALVTLAACWAQFAIGRRIGQPTGDAIAAGQAIGQKNTVFAIWMAYTFLTPITAIAGGFYSVWHNIFNSYQLYRKRKAA